MIVCKSKIKRILKELKRFQKIFIKKGTSQNVEITITTTDLAFYDETISN
ncbi:fibronectin type III-like domain-contianing protein [Polaribacter sp. Q13]|nr:fibronectin type III-like domain-contianing protein [Polaribacter sp. Q13]